MVSVRAPPRKRDVMSHYDTMGGRIYDLTYGLEQSAKYEVILSRLSIEPTDLILDVGCATGLLLNKIGAFSIGVDVSIQLLRRARKRLRGGQGLIQGDAESLPFRDKIFKGVIAVTVLQNIPNPDKFLLEVRRVSRRGAFIVITTLKKFAIEDFKNLVESSGLWIESIFQGEWVKDWIIFAFNP